MKASTCLVAVLVAVVLLEGCRLYTEVSSDYDRTADFTSYHTFAWLADKDTTSTPFNNQVIRNNTMNYFSHCMGERGLRAEVDSPDVLLELVVTSARKEVAVLSPAQYPSYNPYYYPFPNAYYYRGHTGQGSHYTSGCAIGKAGYNESTITLNVIDRRTNKLVWTGRAEGDLYDPVFIESNLHPAVFDILRDFPIALTRDHKRPKR
ncbi:MAG: DUF4136 domain-containing protein [Flavobacteriales bacterium]|nr:DUF4136 domain-containing protein [Flavobacteriales bacterium]